MRVGIDPGLSGAIVLLLENEIINHWPMPIYKYSVKAKNKKKYKNRRSIDSQKLFNILNDIKKEYKNNIEVFIEKQQYAMGVSKGRKDSPMTAFTIGVNYGKILSILDLFWKDNYTIIHPATWKSHAGLRGKRKEAAIDYCNAYFKNPNNFKINDAIADATLIAFFGVKDERIGI